MIPAPELTVHRKSVDRAPARLRSPVERAFAQVGISLLPPCRRRGIMSRRPFGGLWRAGST